MPSSRPLIELTPHGLYCLRGDFFIDPWRPVDRAVITHAHAGSRSSGAASTTWRQRRAVQFSNTGWATDISLQLLDYGEAL
jgi:putative mRNA 3-end processing factor